MRLVHVADRLGYANDGWHGGTTYMTTVLPRLRAAGVDVSAVFLRGEHPAAALLREGRVPVTFLGVSPGAPGNLGRLRRALKAQSPDVVHVTQMESTFLTRVLHARQAKPALVVHVHDLKPQPFPLGMLSRRLPQPDLALCVSAPVKETARIQYGIRPELMRVLHNGLDLGSIRAASAVADRAQQRAVLGLDPQAPLVIAVGRFFPEKGMINLVKAIPAVLERTPAARFLLVGEGPLRAECQSLADTLGVVHALRFLGQRDDIPALLAASDVMAMTSFAEPFGLVAIEAMACGLPVVGFDGGGLPEIVTSGSDGLLARQGDIAGFAGLLGELLEQPLLRSRLGLQARASVERFSLDSHVANLSRFLEEARTASCAQR
jgi:glycosyltransferase involved in cell wall biosynthesis